MSRNNRSKGEIETRYAPDKPFPPYAYIPGRLPHPSRDPRGHSYGVNSERPDPPDPDNWRSCQPYLYAVDLFNHGYYWEAHEAWEELWNAVDRHRPTRHFLQGLIRLAASGVKAREGNVHGVQRHARRAAELFRRTVSTSDRTGDRYMGLCVGEIIGFADTLAAGPERRTSATGSAARLSFDLILHLA